MVVSLSTYGFAVFMGGASSYPASRVVDTAYGKVQGRKLVFKGDKCVDAFQVLISVLGDVS